MDQNKENQNKSENENLQTNSIDDRAETEIWDNIEENDDNVDFVEEAEKESSQLSFEQLQEIISTLQDQNDDLQDKNLRIISEMENLRRRTQREIADSSKYAISKFAKDLLGIYDNLSRALEAVNNDANEQISELTKNLIDGVTITQNELINALSKNNTVKIEVKVGETILDPNLHQAMFVNEDPSIPNNTICQLLQDGFMIGERVLRPSLVGVYKGGPKIARKSDEELLEEKLSEADNASIKAKLDNILKKKPKPNDEPNIDKKA